MDRKRVVVTGYSAFTPLALSADETWERLLAGASGIARVTAFDITDYPSQIAGEVKGFTPEAFGIDFKSAKRMDRFAQFAVAGSTQLLHHANYDVTAENAERTGIILGVGLGGLDTFEQTHFQLMNMGPRKLSPFSIPKLIGNIGPGLAAIATGAKGCNMAIGTACASGTHALGTAYTEIIMGRADAVISGGVEACVRPTGQGGFAAMKALCVDHNDDPEHASRPFDLNRSGFIIAEGAGLLLLESLDSAMARHARIYAEVIGFGASADAFHMTAPEESGDGMARAMINALHDADLSPTDIDHVNAHGTSTRLNDLCETRAMKTVFGKHAYELAISATKSQTGHTLGAAGGIEAIFAILALHTGIVPGTTNLTTPDPECDLNYMTHGAEKLDPVIAVSNSFGFGGTNASIIFKRY